jgi:ubiquinone biosynthesis accessory factor UbiK
MQGTQDVLGPKQLDELSRRVLDNLPSGLAEVHDDVRRNLRAAVTGALGRMDLVTREEFDVQRAVLERTRAKLERLEEKVAQFEASYNN